MSKARGLGSYALKWSLWLATCIGFFATMIMIFDPRNLMLNINEWQLSIYLMAFVMSALLFALLDIINKKYVAQESILTMLFYSNLMASVCGLPFMNFSLVTSSVSYQINLLLLGLGGLGIFFAYLKPIPMHLLVY
ncbi:MAG: hypothetical protein AAF380_01595 [Bacteroidota bacterium]